MQELIVKTTRPIIEANFEAVKQQLIDGLKTYDVIITAETVKDGKTMASEINKIKKAIKDQEKKALEDILGPGNEFKEKIKELLDLAEEAREKITTQVAAYEEKTKLEIQKKIDEFVLEEREKAELRPPFSKIDAQDLVKLTAITKTGNLTSATMNAIIGRVAEQKNLQLEDDARIAQEAKEKEDEIARIREEERIKAEQNIQVHVTVDQPQSNQVDPHENTFAQALQPDYQEPTPEPTHQEYPQSYQEPMPDHDLVTGEVYQDDTPAYMEQPTGAIPVNKVVITAEFEVDITEIPNITNDQLVGAIQKRLKAADVNNATIIGIARN